MINIGNAVWILNKKGKATRRGVVEVVNGDNYRVRYRLNEEEEKMLNRNNTCGWYRSYQLLLEKEMKNEQI